MTPLLILRLEGPLQSWGTRARWDYRNSGDEPTKSGIIGLLGCALGYPRFDKRLEELDRELTLGIRVEHLGLKLVDFHTVSGILPTAEGGCKGKQNDPNTIVSEREYLQDAAFLVVLSGREEILENCRDALRKPKWPLYLGRKSCVPSRPLLESYTDVYSSPEDALRKYPWDFSAKNVLKKPDRLFCILDDTNSNTIRSDSIRVNPARMYGFRYVKTFFVSFPGTREEVEACISPA